LQVALSCYPGGFGPYHGFPSHRWVVTSRDEAEVPKDFRPTDERPFPTLALAQGQAWVFYADKLQHKGALGLLFVPQEKASGVVKVSGYGQRTLLDYPTNTRRIHLGFYVFDVENDAAKTLFVSSIPAELEKLRGIPFWPGQ